MKEVDGHKILAKFLETKPTPKPLADNEIRLYDAYKQERNEALQKMMESLTKDLKCNTQ